MFYKKILATDHTYTMFVSLKKRYNDLSTTNMKKMWRQNQCRFLKDETIYEELFTIVIYCVNVRIDSNLSKFVVPVFNLDHSDSLWSMNL
jgi:hypothetical protein